MRVKTFFKYHILRYLRKIPFIWGSSCIFWFFAIRGQKSNFSSHNVKIKKIRFKGFRRYGFRPVLSTSLASPQGAEKWDRRSIGDDSGSYQLYAAVVSTSSFPLKTCSDWFRPGWSAEENYQSMSSEYINPSTWVYPQNIFDSQKYYILHFNKLQYSIKRLFYIGGYTPGVPTNTVLGWFDALEKRGLTPWKFEKIQPITIHMMLNLIFARLEPFQTNRFRFCSNKNLVVH